MKNLIVRMKRLKPLPAKYVRRCQVFLGVLAVSLFVSFLSFVGFAKKNWLFPGTASQAKSSLYGESKSSLSAESSGPRVEAATASIDGGTTQLQDLGAESLSPSVALASVKSGPSKLSPSKLSQSKPSPRKSSQLKAQKPAKSLKDQRIAGNKRSRKHKISKEKYQVKTQSSQLVPIAVSQFGSDKIPGPYAPMVYDLLLESYLESRLVKLRILAPSESLPADLLRALPTEPPTWGSISSPFGIRKSPFSNREVMHRGVDFAVPHGSPVKAPADGTVVYAGWYGGYGKLLEIDHGFGIVTRYGPNQRLLAEVGDRVERGQAIALAGSSGRSTGPHVHFEVAIHGQEVDPTLVMFPQAQRLIAREGRLGSRSTSQAALSEANAGDLTSADQGLDVLGDLSAMGGEEDSLAGLSAASTKSPVTTALDILSDAAVPADLGPVSFATNLLITAFFALLTGTALLFVKFAVL